MGCLGLYKRIPLIGKLPPRALSAILILSGVNALIWAVIGVVLHFHDALTGTALLAYTFGLRHGFDADHISAIDLMTRRLVATGQKPVTVGTWFSIGHSTIVIITSIVVAATAAAVSSKFNAFSYVGGIVGSSVSAVFLLVLGAANIYIFVYLIKQLKRVLSTAREAEPFKFEGGGLLFRVFKKLFKVVDRPWKMYPVGVLFGLGFDTSSEIALIGIASIQATKGTSLWLILVFPLLFTAAMCLIDTIDGALMMSLYTSASGSKDPILVLYFNIVLTMITVVVALFIGILQILELVIAVVPGATLDDPFWNGVRTVGNRYDVVGGSICGLFAVTAIASLLLYNPWRRWIDRRRPAVGITKDHDADAGGNETDPEIASCLGAADGLDEEEPNAIRKVQRKAGTCAEDVDEEIPTVGKT